MYKPSRRGLRKLVLPAAPRSRPGRQPGRSAGRKWPAGRLSVERLEERALLSSSTLQAITLANTALPASAAAVGSSNNASVSADGRYVAYDSTAANLAAGQANPAITNNVFLFDKTTGTNTLVSHRFDAATAGADNSSYDAVLSGNGRYVYYLSLADNLVAGETGPSGPQHPELFVYDSTTRTTRLVTHDAAADSQRANGSTGDTFLGQSTGAPISVSFDGTRAVYASTATDLVANMTGLEGFFHPNAFLYDYSAGSAGTNTLVSHQVNQPSVAAGGLNPVLSSDGSAVAFLSNGNNLVAGQVEQQPPPQTLIYDGVFLYQVTGAAAGTNKLISRKYGTSTTVANATSDTPAINRDGSVVAFRSDATDLVFQQSGPAGNIFLYDGAIDTTGLVSDLPLRPTVGAGGSPFSNIIDALPLGLSADGFVVVYQSQAGDLVSGQHPATPGDTSSNVFVWTFGDSSPGFVLNGLNSLVSGAGGSRTATATGNSQLPVLSGDGNVLAFESRATDLVPGQASTGSTFNVFVSSLAAALAVQNAPATLVSGANGSATLTANADSLGGELSDQSFYSSPIGLGNDGSVLTFQSRATNLSSGIFKANANTDIFAYGRGGPSLTLVSHGATPTATAGGNSYVAAVSGDDRYAVFVSDAINLVAGQQNNHFGLNIFLRDNNSGAVTLVNHALGSTTATGNTGIPQPPFTPDPINGVLTPPPPGANLLPRISADGNFVAFVSDDTNLFDGQSSLPGHSNVFLFNRQTGAISLVSHVPGLATAEGNYDSDSPAISADGRFVALVSNGGVFLYDATAPAALTQVSGSGSNPSISDDGRYVAYVSSGNVYVYDRAAGTSTLASHALNSAAGGNGPSTNPVLSADGTYVAYVSQATNLVAGQGSSGPPNLTNVFLYNRGAGTNTLISGVNGSATVTGNGSSDSPAIDLDGSYVAFRSDATNLEAQPTAAGSNVFEYSRPAATLTLVSAAAGSPATAANGQSSHPGIDGDGHLVVFLSTATNLVSGQVGGGADNVFLWHRPSGQAVLVSGQGGSFTAASAGSALLPIISRHSFPYFTSTALDLTAAAGASDNGFINTLFQLVLSALTVADGSPAGTVVGTITVSGPPTIGSFRPAQYTLIATATAPDGGAFNLIPSSTRVPDTVATRFVANRAVKGSYQIEIQFDLGFGPDARDFTITVTASGGGQPVPTHLLDVAVALTTSAEYLSNIIVVAYQRYLGRGPDAGGLAYWLAHMEAGLTDERLEAGFIGSAEYIANHGGTGEAWVVGMYHDLLGRGPDAGGLSFWLAQVHGGTPADVIAYGFAASAEREGQRVTADYQRYLGRSPGPPEVGYWVDQFAHGLTNEHVVAGFIAALEYYQNHQGDPRDWLFAAYQDALGRPPDPAGLDHWLAVLQGP